MTTEIFYYILRIPIVLFSLSVHEVAHGYAAYKLGDPTARNLGRLSLNPMKHLDPIGAICMVLFRFGWAKPVPIRSRNLKNPKRDMAICALAGPLSNLIMAFLAYIISCYLLYFGAKGEHLAFNSSWALIPITEAGKIFNVLYLFFDTFFLLNVSLAVFNLLPIPPLDGSRILFVLLPDKLYVTVMKYEQIIYFALMGCLFIGILDPAIDVVFNFFIGIFRLVAQFLPFI